MPYDIKPLSCEPKKLKKAAQPMGCGSHAQPCRVYSSPGALDMYEHSDHMDYGTAAAKYVDAFMENIHWAHVARLHHDYAR